jgi:hypothetical protein
MTAEERGPRQLHFVFSFSSVCRGYWDCLFWLLWFVGLVMIIFILIKRYNAKVFIFYTFISVKREVMRLPKLHAMKRNSGHAHTAPRVASRGVTWRCVVTLTCQPIVSPVKEPLVHVK